MHSKWLGSARYSWLLTLVRRVAPGRGVTYISVWKTEDTDQLSATPFSICLRDKGGTQSQPCQRGHRKPRRSNFTNGALGACQLRQVPKKDLRFRAESKYANFSADLGELCASNKF